MRYAKIALVPESGNIDAIGERLAAEPDVSREALLHINRLEDDSVVTLTRYRGDADRVNGILEDCPGVVSHSVSAVQDGVEAYVHSRPTGAAAALLDLMRKYEFVLDTPVEYGPDGTRRVALIGEETAVREAIENVPGEIRVELERFSEYEPERRGLSSLLTARQREILEAAVRLGYYEVPRRATHKHIAEELGLSTTTVGEHLRKIEARMLSEIAR